MDKDFGPHLLLVLLREHWVSAFFLSLTLSTVLALVCIRWWFKRRWRRLLQEKFSEEEELDTLAPLGPADRQAQERIKEFRQEVWAMTDAELQLNVEVLSRLATRIVRSVAMVYHPEVEVPQYEASLVEILQLIRRVSGRLARLSSVIPFRFLGNRRLSDYQRYYQVYKKINENPILQVLKRNPYVYKAARWAMNVKNIANPLYWAGRELSREGYFYILRLFHLTFISQVGREAMRLYSGRHFLKEEDRDAALGGYRLFDLARQWGGPTPDEWALLVGFITSHPSLEDEVKVHILSRFSQNQLPGDLDRQALCTRSGLKWYQKGLKLLLDKSDPVSSLKSELIQAELRRVESSRSAPSEAETPDVETP